MAISSNAYLLAILFCTGLFGLWGWPLMRTTLAKAMITAGACTLFAAGWWAFLDHWLRSIRPPADGFNEVQREVIPLFAAAAILNLSVALIVRIYSAFILDLATEKERQPNAIGIRAWLSVPSVLAVLTIAAAAQFGFDYGFFGTAILGLCALLLYPTGQILTRSKPIASATPQPPAEERQRVLALVEAGKISAEDAAELLAALAQSQSAERAASPSLSGPRRIMALGSAIMLIAFFLPWFSENLLKAMSELQQSLPQLSTAGPMPMIPTAPGVPTLATPAAIRSMTEVILRGGDIRDGLGWIALAAAIAAAAVPLFWPQHQRDERLMRNVTLAILAAGSIALLYLLSISFNAVTTIEPGFLLAMGSYGILWIGAIKEHRSHQAQFQPIPAGA